MPSVVKETITLWIQERKCNTNFRLIFLHGWNQMKTLYAFVSLEGFIFSWALDKIYLIAASLLLHTCGVMREYFPRVWKQIRAVLLETLINQPEQLFLCLPSFWWVMIHSIKLVNVKPERNFCWVSDQWLKGCQQYIHIFHQGWFNCSVGSRDMR